MFPLLVPLLSLGSPRILEVPGGPAVALPPELCSPWAGDVPQGACHGFVSFSSPDSFVRAPEYDNWMDYLNGSDGRALSKRECWHVHACRARASPMGNSGQQPRWEARNKRQRATMGLRFGGACGSLVFRAGKRKSCLQYGLWDEHSQSSAFVSSGQSLVSGRSFSRGYGYIGVLPNTSTDLTISVLEIDNHNE